MNMTTPLPIPAVSAAINAASLRALRRQVEDRVEHLIALLDRLDTDPDLEDDGTAEPWLGWTGSEGPGAILYGDVLDRELDPDTDEGDAPHGVVDEEPALGWPNSHQGKGPARASSGTSGLWDEDEDTALENAGRGFIRSGGDDAEDNHDAEDVNEDGTYEDLDPDEDGEGDFAGGTVLGADGHSFVVTVNDPDSWVRA